MLGSEKKTLIKYKNIPMVRNKNTILYGNPSDTYIIKLDILDSYKAGDDNSADNIIISLVSTEDLKVGKINLIKQKKVVGLFNALDIAFVWWEMFSSQRPT